MTTETHLDFVISQDESANQLHPFSKTTNQFRRNAGAIASGLGLKFINDPILLVAILQIQEGRDALDADNKSMHSGDIQARLKRLLGLEQPNADISPLTLDGNARKVFRLAHEVIGTAREELTLIHVAAGLVQLDPDTHTRIFMDEYLSAEDRQNVIDRATGRISKVSTAPDTKGLIVL